MEWTNSSGFIIVCLLIKYKYEFIRKTPKSWFFGRMRQQQALVQLTLCVPGPGCYIWSISSLVIKTPQDKAGQVRRILGKGVIFQMWLLSWGFYRLSYSQLFVSSGSASENSTKCGLNVLEKKIPESSQICSTLATICIAFSLY